MKTYVAKKEEVQRKWYLIDASGKTLGRLASEVAKILRGKHKPIYTPHVDTGDYVIVVNAEQIHLSGKKWENKTYYHYTGYPRGLRAITAKQLQQQKPERIIERAVQGMLPKTKLGRHMRKKLKIYATAEHPHQAQQPEVLEISS